MVRSASKWGCYLGFFREDFLRWGDLSGELANAPAAPAGSQDTLAYVVCGLPNRTSEAALCAVGTEVRP